MLVNNVSVLKDVIGPARKFQIQKSSIAAPQLCSSNQLERDNSTANFECLVNRAGQFRLQIAGVKDDLRKIPVSIRHIESGKLTRIDNLFSTTSGYIAELAIEMGFPREGEFEILVGEETKLEQFETGVITEEDLELNHDLALLAEDQDHFDLGNPVG